MYVKIDSTFEAVKTSYGFSSKLNIADVITSTNWLPYQTPDVGARIHDFST